MNQRGVYTALIGLMVLAIVAAMIFGASVSLSKTQAESYSKEIVEIKRVWQNTRYLLDKATAEKIFNSNCSAPGNYDFRDITATIETKTGIICTATPLEAGTTRFDVMLGCSKLVEKAGDTEFYVSYQKTFGISKSTRTDPDTGECIVIDEQSGLQELPVPTP